MQLEDIKKLAEMARLDMTEEELKNMANEFDPILAYVGQVKEVSELSDENPEYILTNVMRDDISTNKTGEHTDKILEEMPDKKDGFLKVKQIL
jgi:aspartyl-tRNA(Asn)/glutamyl-tRNA(Gln) amidotransferase subunit C